MELGYKIFEFGSKLANIVITDEKIQNDLQRVTLIGQMIVLGIDIAETIIKQSKTEEEKIFGSLVKIIFSATNEVFKIEQIEYVEITELIEKEKLFSIFTKTQPYHNDFSIMYQPLIGEFFTILRGILIEKISEEKLNALFHIIHSVLVQKLKEDVKINEFVKTYDSVQYSDNLLEYLKSVEKKKYEHNEIDNTQLIRTFVEPKMALVSASQWEKHDYDRIMQMGKRFEWEMFLDAPFIRKRLTVAGTFGIGKTSSIKILAANLATKCIANPSNPGYAIPIVVTLNSKLDSVYGDLDLDSLLDEIAPTDEDKKNRRILLILDGLDEYPDNKETLIKKIEKYWPQYRQLKVIFTTRLESGFPEILKIHQNEGQYVRIFPFTPDQVNEYFKNYGISELNYDKIKKIGLDEHEIRKPLFCWMFAVSSINPDFFEKISTAWRDNMKKTILYMEFLHTLFRGKHKSQSNDKDYSVLFLIEKKILRKIAAEKHLLEEMLFEENIDKIIATIYTGDSQEIKNKIKPIITSYFHLKDKDGKNNFDFIHRTFREYLLAEYYFENIVNGVKPYEINIKPPTKETLEFLEGIIEFLFHTDSDKFQDDKRDFLKTILNSSVVDLEKSNFIQEIKNLILNNSYNYLQNDNIACFAFENSSYEQIESWHILNNGNDILSEFWMHKWIALFVIKKLDPRYLIPKEQIVIMIKKYSHLIPKTLRNFLNIDLSHVDLSHVDLSDAKLSGSNLFNATLTDVNLSRSKLDKKETILRKAYLEECNLTDSDLSNANLVGSTIMRSNCLNANFSECILNDVDFKKSILIQTNFKNTKLSESKFQSTNIIHSDFTNAIMTSSVLSNSVIHETTFVNAILYNATLTSSHLFKIDFSQADLSSADLSNSEIINPNFCGTKLNEVKLVNTKIHNALVDDSTDTTGIILIETDSNEQISDKSKMLSKTIQDNLKIKTALENIDKTLLEKIIKDNPKFKKLVGEDF